MLSFGPPYFQIDGMTVMSDFHDPLQFHYFPNRPKLAVDEQGRPAIRFIILKEAQDEILSNAQGQATEDDLAGFLIFDCDLKWDSQAIAKAARFIKQNLNLDRDPRLVPLNYKSGTVQLSLLDRTSTLPSTNPAGHGGGNNGGTGGTGGTSNGNGTNGQGGATTDPNGTTATPPSSWVRFMYSAGVPSLYGDNRAMFSVELTRRATKLLYGCFSGFLPAGVVYNLEFVGMQTAYRVKVSADWVKAYDFVQEHYGVDFVFLTADIDNIVEKLEEHKIIKIEASLEMEGAEAEVVSAEFEQVRRELTELVANKFFEPVPNPDKATPDSNTVNQVMNVARQVRNLVNLWPSAGYTRRSISLDEVRSIQADYSVSRAVSRRIAPQAHMSLFFEDFGLTRDDLVTVVNGNDALWNTTHFDAVVNADFAADAIHSVALDVQYRAADAPDPNDPNADPDAAWSFLFNSADQRFQRSAWYDPAIGHHYRYRYSVFFKPSAVPGPTPSLSSAWLEHDSQLLVLSPEKLYTKGQCEVQVAADFPWDRYPNVAAQLRHHVPDWQFEDTKLLNRNDSSMSFKFRTWVDQAPKVEVRLTYFKAGGGTQIVEWQPVDGDLVVVNDPMPPRPKVRVIVAGDRSRILNLIVDFRYIDLENHVHANASLSFDASNLAQAQVWEIPAVDLNKRRYEYAQTLIDLDGNVTATGFQQEERSTITVGETFVKLMEVQAEVIGPAFALNQLERLQLTLRYRDPANHIAVEDQQMFSQPGVGTPWKVKLLDAGLRDYTWEARYVFTNGFERVVGPVAARDKYLLISSKPPQG